MIRADWCDRRSKTEEALQRTLDAVAESPEAMSSKLYWDRGQAAPVLRGWTPCLEHDGGHDFEVDVAFAGWSRTDDREDDTYGLHEYFDGHGAYLGPDQHGVHPTFRVV